MKQFKMSIIRLPNRKSQIIINHDLKEYNIFISGDNYDTFTLPEETFLELSYISVSLNSINPHATFCFKSEKSLSFHIDFKMGWIEVFYLSGRGIVNFDNEGFSKRICITVPQEHTVTYSEGGELS